MAGASPEAQAPRLGLAGGGRRGAAGEAPGLIGYAYIAQFRNRSAYRFAAENSVYVRERRARQGVGKALVAVLIERAEAAGFRQMFAVIGDSDNVGSIGLHLSLGFQRAGVLKAAGVKFGRWLDVVFMRSIGSGDGVPARAGRVEPGAARLPG